MLHNSHCTYEPVMHIYTMCHNGICIVIQGVCCAMIFMQHCFRLSSSVMTAGYTILMSCQRSPSTWMPHGDRKSRRTCSNDTHSVPHNVCIYTLWYYYTLQQIVLSFSAPIPSVFSSLCRLAVSC